MYPPRNFQRKQKTLFVGLHHLFYPHVLCSLSLLINLDTHIKLYLNHVTMVEFNNVAWTKTVRSISRKNPTKLFYPLCHFLRLHKTKTEERERERQEENTIQRAQVAKLVVPEIAQKRALPNMPCG